MENLLSQGEEHFSREEFEEARECFAVLLEKDPRNKEAYNNLGVMAYQEGNYPEATEFFKKALTVDPLYEEAVLNLSHVLKNTGELRQIVPFVERVAAARPDDAVWHNLPKETRSNREEEKKGTGYAGVIPAHRDPGTAKAGHPTWRVLHGTYEVANQMNTIAAGLNGEGITARTVCYYPNYLGYTFDYSLDVSRLKSRPEAILATRRMAEPLISEFDIFHFHFNTTLTLDHSDLPRLRQLGKVMTMQYWGSDARLLSRAREMNPYAVVKDHDEDAIKRKLEFMARFMPDAVTGDYEVYEYLKDFYNHVYVVPAVIDMTRYRASPVKNDRFLIVHAPTSAEFKGSRHILAALEDLKQRYDFDFRLIQGMAHDEAKAVYAMADLIVDELHAGSYGLLAVESMAMGKPVITWVCDFMKEKYPSDLPLLSANPDTVKDRIEYALKNREMLPELGKRGVDYVAKYHDIRAAIPKYIDMYSKLAGRSSWVSGAREAMVRDAETGERVNR
jgi:tetratricopeptide (TPR) repeat protein